MQKTKRGQPLKTKWAYGYKIQPAQPEHRLSSIKALLDHAHAVAKRGARTWAGRVVLEEQVTHILVVSDSPAQNRAVNRKLEAELKALNVGFTRTASLAIADGAASRFDSQPVSAAL